jgi:hypothetical protein
VLLIEKFESGACTISTRAFLGEITLWLELRLYDIIKCWRAIMDVILG